MKKAVRSGGPIIPSISLKQVLSKHRIVDYAWPYDFSGSPDIVETYVFYLRKKLDPFGPSLIHTIRHVGYILRERPTSA